MGLFKSEEEKAAAHEEKIQKVLERYSLTGLKGQDAEDVKRIATVITGANLMELGNAMGAGNPAQTTAAYSRILVEQNFIIIRKLCELAEKE